MGLDEDEEADLDGSTGAAGGLDDIARDVLADNDGPALRALAVKLALHVLSHELCLSPTVADVHLAVKRVGPGARAPRDFASKVP